MKELADRSLFAADENNAAKSASQTKRVSC